MFFCFSSNYNVFNLHIVLALYNFIFLIFSVFISFVNWYFSFYCSFYILFLRFWRLILICFAIFFYRFCCKFLINKVSDFFKNFQIFFNYQIFKKVAAIILIERFWKYNIMILLPIIIFTNQGSPKLDHLENTTKF